MVVLAANHWEHSSIYCNMWLAHDRNSYSPYSLWCGEVVCLWWRWQFSVLRCTKTFKSMASLHACGIWWRFMQMSSSNSRWVLDLAEKKLYLLKYSTGICITLQVPLLVLVLSFLNNTQPWFLWSIKRQQSAKTAVQPASVTLYGPADVCMLSPWQLTITVQFQFQVQVVQSPFYSLYFYESDWQQFRQTDLTRRSQCFCNTDECCIDN